MSARIPGLTGEKSTRLMLARDELATDVGSVVYGEKAVSMGLIDRLGGLNDALTCLHRMIDRQKKQRQ